MRLGLFLILLPITGFSNPVGEEFADVDAITISNSWNDWVVVGRFGPEGPFHLVDFKSCDHNKACSFSHNGQGQTYSGFDGYQLTVLRLENVLGEVTHVVLRSKLRSDGGTNNNNAINDTTPLVAEETPALLSAETPALSSEERLEKLDRLTDEKAAEAGMPQSQPLSTLRSDQIQPEMLIDKDIASRRTAFLELHHQITRVIPRSPILSRPDDVKIYLIESLLGGDQEFELRASHLVYALSLQALSARMTAEARDEIPDHAAGPLALGMSNDPWVRNALFQTLRNSDHDEIRARAAVSLGNFFDYSEEIEATIASVLKRSSDPDVIAAIAHSLWTMYWRPNGEMPRSPSVSALQALTISLGRCNFRNCSRALDIIGSARPQFALTKLVSELPTAEDIDYFLDLVRTIEQYESLPPQIVESLRSFHDSDIDATRKVAVGRLLGQFNN